jgi:hypothetical protein
MLIGGAASYPAPAAFLLPARSLAASVSPDVSADITRATQPPVTAPQPLADEQSASAREEADQAPQSNQDRRSADQNKASPRQERIEQLEIAKLSKRDQEVRAHEQAHAAVGGRYTGAPTYTYTSGPDGKRYAVGGEVSIESGAIPNDPEATLRKMEVVLRAALAPAEPSPQDMQVAAQAQVTMAQARAELAQLRREEALASREAQAQRTEEVKQKETEQKEIEKKQEGQTKSSNPVQQDLPPPPSLELYQRSSALAPLGTLINMQA